MTPEEEIRRGSRAKQVLDNEIYQESFTLVRDRLISLLESADLDADKRARVNDLLVQHRKARQYLEQVMQGGKMAAEQIERDKKLGERVRERFM